LVALLTGVAAVALAHQEPSDQEPKYGGTLIISNRVEMKTLNPNVDVDMESFFVTHAGVYDRLVELDTESGNVFPDLAESWEVSENANQFTFKLHPDAKWHDGEPVTSADVAWTFNKIIDEQAWQSSVLNVIDSIETPDDHTVILNLREPNAAFLSRLGELNAPVILPAHIYEGTDWTANPANESPVGSGPFKFVEWVKGSHVELAANTEYHWGRPYVDHLILRFIPAQAVDMAALESGEIHYMSQSPPFGELDRLSQNPDLAVILEKRVLPIWVAFNLRHPPMDDLRVRQAIAMATDEEDISNRAYFGYCPVAKGAYLSSSWAYNPDALEPTYNPDEAERLLDEAGYPQDADGKRFEITVVDSITMGFAETNQIMKEQLAEVGIDVKIESIEWGSFTEKVLKKYDFDVALVGGPHGPDPDTFSNFLETDKLRNTMGYSSPRVDELFQLGRSTGDIGQRKEYYQEIQEIVIEDLPRYNIVEYTWPCVYRTDWHGIPCDPDYDGMIATYDMSHVWWDGATGSELGSTSAAPGGTSLVWWIVGALAVVAVVAVAAYLVLFRKKAEPEAEA
jgi:peptide/nickel transport system substrate-binding protein